MNHYSYQCFDCASQYSIEEIEPVYQYLCPSCFKTEKNRPLRGVLRITYDYQKIKRTFSGINFLDFPCGEFWHYPWLWPLDFREEKGNTILRNIPTQRLNRIALSTRPLW